uniref:hydroxylysine kinase-like n=1 Tax=Styela clava TaxID=7725 RepID=UPI00193A7211|nr:hydroxylysine kinase-like [Styela clava]
MEWKMENIQSWKKKIHVLKDVESKNICEQTMKKIEDFCSGNLYIKASKGIIHGDLTLRNLIYKKDGHDYDVTGIIDFYDTSISCYIFETAGIICSVLYEADFLDLPDLNICAVTKEILGGYRKEFDLNNVDLNMLFYAVLARLCALRVLGGYYIMHRNDVQIHTGINLEKLEIIMKKIWKLGKTKWDEICLQS